MDQKLIFLDIDGTLVTGLKPPSPLSREAVRGARSRGHLVFLCTGRNLPVIGPEILALGFDGMVASAGSYVSFRETVLLDSLLPEALVQECLALFHANGVYCRIETPEGIYTDPPMEALVRRAVPTPGNAELLRLQQELDAGMGMQPYAAYPRQGAYKICFTAPDRARVAPVQARLADRFDFVIQPYGQGTICNGEIIPRGRDKGTGMALLCAYLHRPLADTVAFGDSMNDAAMMRRAGIRVAMGNACPDLKALCGAVCEDVAHDGIYHQFRRMGLC